VYTDDAGEVLLEVLTNVEEASHSLAGQLVMDVGHLDEAFPVMIVQFATEQGEGGEAVEDLEKEILCEAGRCVRPLVEGLLYFVSVQ
jgi:hypothetical protein